MAILLRVDPSTPDAAALRQAATALRAGQLVAFPTETVYGLGGNALDPKAVQAIFAAKGRPPTNPLIVHVADVAAARTLSRAWPEVADRLAAAFWPGPLTLVVPARADLPTEVTAGLPHVGVRIPAHPVALALLTVAGVPVAAPSANRSNEVSPTTAAHVAASLGETVPLILDGGPTNVGIESTVLDLTGPTPVLLRPGGVPRLAIEAITGPVAVTTTAVPESEHRASPGMMARHYAPRARVLLVQPSEVDAAIAAETRSGLRVGALVHSAAASTAAVVVRLPPDAEGYARGLYAALHDLDAAVAVMVIEAVPDTPAWEGVADRLRRASHPG